MILVTFSTGRYKLGLFITNQICEFSLNDIDFHPWGEWSNCSKSCGEEMRTRNRTCLEDGKCTKYERKEKCNVSECDEDGKFSP